MPTVRSSARFAHSECILVTMMCSQDEEERRFALLKIRGEEENMGDRSVRLRVLPNLNIKRTNLRNLIEWENATEPIITCHLTKSQLLEFMRTPMEVEYIPCHTQAIERAVKEVTAAANAVCGEDRRYRFSGEELSILSWCPTSTARRTLWP